MLAASFYITRSFTSAHSISPSLPKAATLLNSHLAISDGWMIGHWLLGRYMESVFLGKNRLGFSFLRTAEMDGSEMVVSMNFT